MLLVATATGTLLALLVTTGHLQLFAVVIPIIRSVAFASETRVFFVYYVLTVKMDKILRLIMIIRVYTAIPFVVLINWCRGHDIRITYEHYLEKMVLVDEIKGSRLMLKEDHDAIEELWSKLDILERIEPISKCKHFLMILGYIVCVILINIITNNVGITMLSVLLIPLFYLNKLFHWSLKKYNGQLVIKMILKGNEQLQLYNDIAHFIVYKKDFIDENKFIRPYSLVKGQRFMLTCTNKIYNFYMAMKKAILFGEKHFKFESNHKIIFHDFQFEHLLKNPVRDRDMVEKTEELLYIYVLVTSNFFFWLTSILTNEALLSEEYFLLTLQPVVSCFYDMHKQLHKEFHLFRFPPPKKLQNIIVPRHPLYQPVDRFIANTECIMEIMKLVRDELQKNKENVDEKKLAEVFEITATELANAVEKLEVCQIMLTKCNLKPSETIVKPESDESEIKPVISISGDAPILPIEDEEYEILIRADDQSIPPPPPLVIEESPQVPKGLMKELSATLYRRLIVKGKEPFVKPPEDIVSEESTVDEPTVDESTIEEFMGFDENASLSSDGLEDLDPSDPILKKMAEASVAFPAQVIHSSLAEKNANVPSPPSAPPLPMEMIYIDNDVVTPMRMPPPPPLVRTVAEEVYTLDPDLENESQEQIVVAEIHPEPQPRSTLIEDDSGIALPQPPPIPQSESEISEAESKDSVPMRSYELRRRRK